MLYKLTNQQYLRGLSRVSYRRNSLNYLKGLMLLTVRLSKNIQNISQNAKESQRTVRETLLTTEVVVKQVQLRKLQAKL